MNTLLLISIFISLFCVGLRIASSKGMIFYFLRKPYDEAMNLKRMLSKQITDFDATIIQHLKEIEMLRNGEILMADDSENNAKLVTERVKFLNEYVVSLKPASDKPRRELKYINARITILKPVIGCGTCMASFWTLIWWIPMLEILELPIDSIESYWGVIPVAFITAAFNSLILGVYDLIKIKQECNCK